MYKRQPIFTPHVDTGDYIVVVNVDKLRVTGNKLDDKIYYCLLYTSDAADERSSVDLGGRRIIKKKHSLRQSGREI